MAGNGAARSAGVAYIDLAVGEAQGLIDGISQIVRQAADAAQAELSRGFDLSGHASSFQAVVDAAAEAASGASDAISGALNSSAEDSAAALSESIVSSVTEAASAAGDSLTSSLGDAGREAGEQLALNFVEAAQDIQLPLFETDSLVSQAAEEGRAAGEALTEGLNESTASLGSVFSAFNFRGMTEDVGEFTDSLTGGLRFAATGIAGFAADAKDKVASDLKAAGEEGGEGLFASFSEFGKGLTYSVGTWGVGMAIGQAISSGVSGALSAAKSAVIDFNSEMQSAQISFGTLLGSDNAGNAELSQLKQFALSTPFQFENLVEDSQHLLALGISAQNIIPDLKGLGDAVSALGGDGSTLDSVTQIFGEMQSKGQVMETNIRELQIRGIPALQILANEYGVSTTQLSKMITAGQVMASDALPKLIDGMEKGTKTTTAMGGEMAKQSLTFTGSISNLKDGLTQFAAAAGKPIFDTLNAVTAKLADFASGGQLGKFIGPVSKTIASMISDTASYVEKLLTFLKPVGPLIEGIVSNLVRFSVAKQVLEALGPIFMGVAQAIGAIAKNKAAVDIIEFLVEAFLILKGAQEAYNIVLAVTNALMKMNPFGLFVLAITAVVIGLVALYQHSALFRDIVKDVGAVAGDVWHGIVVGFDWAKSELEEGFDYVSHLFSKLFNSGPAKSAFSWLVTAFTTVRTVVEVEIRAIGSVLSWLWGQIQVFGFIVYDAIRTVGAIFSWLWTNAISPVIQAIWFGLRLLFVIVFTLLVTPFVIAFHLLEPVLKTLLAAFVFSFEEIGKGAEWLWKEALKPAFDWIGSLFTGGLPKAVQAFWRDDIEPAFQGIAAESLWLWKNVLVPVGHGMEDVLGAVGAAAVWLYKNAIEPASAGIADAAQWLWKNIFIPTGVGIEDVLSVLGSIFGWLWKEAIEPAFDKVEAGTLWLWHEVFEPAFSGIGTAAKWLYSNLLKPAFDDVVNGLHDVGTWASWLYDNAIKPVFDKIGSVISATLTDVKNGFKTAVDGINSVWSGLIDDLKGPVNFLVNTVYTNGVEEVWNFIADKVGIPRLPDAPHFADGGVVNGPRSAGDWIPLYATAGEGILTVDEMSALGGPNGFAALRALLGGGGTDPGDGHFASGGVVGSIWDGFKSVGSVIGSGVSDLDSFASRITSGALQAVAKDMLKPVLGGLSDMVPGPSTTLKSLLTGIPTALVNKILGWLGNKDSSDKAKAAAGLPASVAGWIDQAETAAGVGSDWTTGLAEIISHESGGNPNATNLTDSNARAGDPSRGLMQTIMSTFEAYRLPSQPDDIFNPVANIVAGIRYIQARYGTLTSVPGIKSLASGGNYVGYATGTNSAPPGWAWVGENGPELLKLGGGETILPAPQSRDISRSWTAPQYSMGTPDGSAAVPIVNVYIDGEKFDGRIQVQIQDNNDQLAQILNGGITA